MIKSPLSVLGLAVLLGFAAGCDSGTEPKDRALPNTITECEGYTANVCGTWTRSSTGYTAVWSNGSTADITVLRFDADSAKFSRRDLTGPTAGGTATYRAAFSTDHAIAGGTVTWVHADGTYNGVWTAQW